jgi:NADPH:quinone reductase-like Zn-dependent oxidoreductase
MPPSSYRKLLVTKRSHIFSEAVQIVEVPWQEPGPGEVVVRNMFAGVNASIGMFTGGFYPVTPPLPHDVFSEAAGEVVAVGPDVTTARPGEMVISFGNGFSEYQLLQAATVIPVPKATPEIITLLISALTASIALEQVGEMKSGEAVLVTAAAGGTGQFAVQLAKLAGNHVIGTCSVEEKAV